MGEDLFLEVVVDIRFFWRFLLSGTMFVLDEETQDEEPLGGFLARKRKERGVSLRQVSTETRIGLPFLENIEGGEFYKMPGVFYARGFVRAYAACIGLDPDEMANRFNAEVCRKAS